MQIEKKVGLTKGKSMQLNNKARCMQLEKNCISMRKVQRIQLEREKCMQV